MTHETIHVANRLKKKTRIIQSFIKKVRKTSSERRNMCKHNQPIATMQLKGDSRFGLRKKCEICAAITSASSGRGSDAMFAGMSSGSSGYILMHSDGFP